MMPRIIISFSRRSSVSFTSLPPFSPGAAPIFPCTRAVRAPFYCRARGLLWRRSSPCRRSPLDQPAWSRDARPTNELRRRLSRCQFARLTLRDFLAIDSDVARRIDADTHLIPVDSHDGDSHVGADHDRFTDPSCQNETHIVGSVSS